MSCVDPCRTRPSLRGADTPDTTGSAGGGVAATGPGGEARIDTEHGAVAVPGCTRATFAVRGYDLAATLDSGQAFRWQAVAGAWEGVIDARWVRVCPEASGWHVQTAVPVDDWGWFRRYFQTDVDLEAVLGAFPDDPALRAARAACRGLRLLRQDPWECLASFLCSATKQIVQIRQMVDLLSRRFGAPVPVPPGHSPAFAFPSARRIAGVDEAALRACKLGFRAPHLRAAAGAVADGTLALEPGWPGSAPLSEARAGLMALPGVGRKIADCVLLFAGGRAEVFPVDVWMQRALREYYFPRRSVSALRLVQFAESHFGPQAGYAQQYLFHFMRTVRGRAAPRACGRAPSRHA